MKKHDAMLDIDAVLDDAEATALAVRADLDWLPRTPTDVVSLLFDTPLNLRAHWADPVRAWMQEGMIVQWDATHMDDGRGHYDCPCHEVEEGETAFNPQFNGWGYAPGQRIDLEVFGSWHQHPARHIPYIIADHGLYANAIEHNAALLRARFDESGNYKIVARYFEYVAARIGLGLPYCGWDGWLFVQENPDHVYEDDRPRG